MQVLPDFPVIFFCQVGNTMDIHVYEREREREREREVPSTYTL